MDSEVTTKIIENMLKELTRIKYNVDKDLFEKMLLQELLSNKPICLELNERQTYILRKRIGVYDDGKKISYEKIGNEYNETKENIRQRLNNILKNIYAIYLRRRRYISNHPELKNEIIKKHIDYLKLPDEVEIALKIAGYNTIDELMHINEIEFKDICSRTSTNELILKRALLMLGLRFLFEPPETQKIKIEGIFSNRTYLCLKRVGINNLEDLLCYSEDDLLHIENIGKVTIDEIKKTLNHFGKDLYDLKQKNNESLNSFDDYNNHDEEVIKNKYNKLIRDKMKLVEMKFELERQIQSIEAEINFITTSLNNKSHK